MKRVVVGVAALALGISGVGFAQAQAPEGYKVNGGGQIIFDSEGGPGDTVAFTAQQLEGNDGDAPARGQFQYVERSGDGSSLHGEVKCLRVHGDDEGYAVVEGKITRGDRAGETFRLDIFDGGPASNENDYVKVDFKGNDDPKCDLTQAPEDNGFKLGRGNVTIHEPKGGEE